METTRLIKKKAPLDKLLQQLQQSWWCDGDDDNDDDDGDKEEEEEEEEQEVEEEEEEDDDDDDDNKDQNHDLYLWLINKCLFAFDLNIALSKILACINEDISCRQRLIPWEYLE